MNRTVQSWLNATALMRLIAVVILVISVFMTAMVFTISLRLENQSLLSSFQFSRDFSLTVAHDIMSLLEHNDLSRLKSFVEQIYLTTSSIRYIQLYDLHGNMILSFPAGYEVLQNMTCLQSNSPYCNYDSFFFSIPIAVIRANFHDSVINSIVPLMQSGSSFGFLRLGLSFGFNILTIYTAFQKISIAVFASVWLMFTLGAILNSCSLVEPTKQLLLGLQSIAAGNFDYKIDYIFDNQLGDLAATFNQMSERLRYCEKKNISQLVSEKAKLEALVSTIADGAILLDTELRLLFVNQVAVKVFHWSNKDLIGQAVSRYLPIHVNEALLPILNSMIKSNCFDNKIMYAQEVTVDLRYESLKTFRFLLSTVLSQSDKVLHGIVITIQDITREAQLNAAKNQFIGNVSHELRTPLCNIGSFLETLIDYRYKLRSDQVDQFLSIAHTETQRLNRLVNDILDLSRLETEYSYLLSSLSLGDTISYIIRSSQIVALNKNIRVIVEIHSDLERILAHESSFCQVLFNLIGNSLKFTHSGGQIVIRAYPLFPKVSSGAFNELSPQIARVEVVDEGVGINKMFQKQIFDRFMRIENNIHTLEGTGLGLSIVKNIVEKHNSAIYVYSEVGVGTSFWFDLFIVYER